MGLLQYLYLSNFGGFIATFCGFLARNIIMERCLNFVLSKKEFINPKHDRTSILDKNYPSIIFHYMSSTFVETLTNMVIYNYYAFKTTNIIFDLLMFIPISFVYEMLFDLFHYTAHRLEHSNGFLYKNVHKVHHTYSHPTTILTYYHHPIDLILSNTIPQYLTLCAIPKISPITYNLIIIYKIFIEISGHSGKNINSSCFPQFIWLPKLLGIEMYTEDHDSHHKLNNCNYAKRFVLWDKLFGTYKKTYTNNKFIKKN
jgi:sterol desaturase/sphingolipid hydroxylase (fatty acid hydroxylase superfamily)